jgi:hypothetical protein
MRAVVAYHVLYEPLCFQTGRGQHDSTYHILSHTLSAMDPCEAKSSAFGIQMDAVHGGAQWPCYFVHGHRLSLVPWLSLGR